MDTPKPMPADSSRLCTACGLCCREEFFDFVWVEEPERDPLADLGLEIYRGKDDRLRFDLTCRRYSGSCCEIYADRPAACRAFRCKLLRAYEAGKVEEADALDRVSEAHALIEKAGAMLEPDQSLRRSTWKPLLERWEQESASKTLSPRFAAGFLALLRLNRFLDVHFRDGAPPVGRGENPEPKAD